MVILVKVIFANEEIKHDKEKLCGWQYKEIKMRIDYKTKPTIFRKYIGYCQLDFEPYSDNFKEKMSIYMKERGFPQEKTILDKVIRKGTMDWNGDLKIL